MVEKILRWKHLDVGSNRRESSSIPKDWSASQRNQCIYEGIQEWNLDFIQNGYRYLGTIAFNGGLPMNLLASYSGKMGDLLGRILRIIGPDTDTNSILQMIRSDAHLLPKSYQHEEVYYLLADLTRRIIDYTKKAKIGSADDAIVALDRYDPQWRDTFPLPIDDDQARKLLEVLFHNAAEIRTRPQDTLFFSERFLQKREGEWNLNAQLFIPESITHS